MPDPRRPDEAMVNEFAAKMYKWHVGSVVRFGFFSNAQLGQSGFPTSPATRIVNVRITGIGVANTEVVQDQIDTIPSMILTPALTRPLVSCCISYAWSGLILRRGAADVPAVESGYLHLLPPGYPYYFHVTSVIENEAQQAVKPEAIALAVFGLIAGLATVLIAIQLMGRLILVTGEEREVMWFVGARPWNTATDSLLGIVISLLLGAAGAAVVAVALSPLLVFGPLQSVVPASGIHRRLDGARARCAGSRGRPGRGRGRTEPPRLRRVCGRHAWPTGRSGHLTSSRLPPGWTCRSRRCSACGSPSREGAGARRSRCARPSWPPPSPSSWWWAASRLAAA